MARAESYGEIARLEQLLDEYANVSAMDPAKVPALRGEIWTLIQAAQLEHDLGLEVAPADEAFDEFVMHVDGWLCEIKDAQIRDGLHILGQPPAGDELVAWCWPCFGPTSSSPDREPRYRGCGRRLGLAEGGHDRRGGPGRGPGRALVEAVGAGGLGSRAVRDRQVSTGSPKTGRYRVLESP